MPKLKSEIFYDLCGKYECDCSIGSYNPNCMWHRCRKIADAYYAREQKAALKQPYCLKDIRTEQPPIGADIICYGYDIVDSSEPIQGRRKIISDYGNTVTVDFLNFIVTHWMEIPTQVPYEDCDGNMTPLKIK